MTNITSAVEVTQAARYAAADIAEMASYCDIGGNDAASFRLGVWDDDTGYLGQFVRLVAQVQADARLAALEEAAKVAEMMTGQSDASLKSVNPEGLARAALQGNISASRHIATAIRALVKGDAS